MLTLTSIIIHGLNVPVKDLKLLERGNVIKSKKEFSDVVGADMASLQVIGDVLLQVTDILSPILTIVFITGTMLLYTLFYLTKLIPRWLSSWGLIGAVIYLVVDLLKLFGLNLHLDILYIPLALQEMAMALWLVMMSL